MTRQRPWRHEHPDAVVVARPSKWGNPYRVEQNLTRQGAVWRFRDLVEQCDHAGTPYALGFTRGAEGIWTREIVSTIRAELVGKDLACWCKTTDPCHADVLLELANATETLAVCEREARES